ncbi:hypothetical protein Phi13:2_gp090 [Cellulophaga phage phi13:2]|uniref:Uncharacterized protein n=1 Tax=Cellulophaga phage phi13:2 TaxID=1328030 RepID=S0A4J0_9CAUD|nr:hypothetical protein Phi13:2_gp090 [Cellulophaga phage phi13:2]AGO49700.1 hypothetical protein Phi13:2_gp090 [Cellulophaga phage phi13:2]
MYNKIPPFFLGTTKFVSRYNYKRRILAFRLRCAKKRLRQKAWVRRIIRSKVLVYIPVAMLSIKLYIEREARVTAEVKAALYESQAKSTIKTFDDMKVSYFEKLLRKNYFIMLGTNDYYDEQFTSRLGFEGIDYLGKKDSDLQDTTSAYGYSKSDMKVVYSLDREWFREYFIVKKDTQELAVFKFCRIELNKDTVVGGLPFDMEKLKKELKLKDIE